MWRAFRRFLDDFPDFKEVPPEAYKLWEHYLVFGILFGNAKKIIKMLPVILADERAAAPAMVLRLQPGGVRRRGEPREHGRFDRASCRPRSPRPAPRPPIIPRAAEEASAAAEAAGRRRRRVGRVKTAFRPAVAAPWRFLACCSAGSEEARIAKLMDRVGSLAENRDLPGLLALLTEDYADFEGRDRAATEALVADHFRRRHGIVVHLLHTEIGEVRPDGTATVEADVVLSSGAAEILRKIVRFAGEFYRFELELRKTPEGWRVAGRNGRPSSPDEPFPRIPARPQSICFPGRPDFAPGPGTPEAGLT